jgi:ankyrin repeat protein
LGLSGACEGGNIEIVNLMIKKGADDWDDGLDYACDGGYTEIVKLMLIKGADVSNFYSTNLDIRQLECKIKNIPIECELIIDFDPIYTLLMIKYTGDNVVSKLPMELLRFLKTFL